MANTHGRVTAITVLTPVRRGWTTWLRLSWPVASRLPIVARPLLRLAFIHFAHWAIVDRLGSGDPGRPTQRVRPPRLLFHSNFDGDWDQYIDAFSHVVPGRMTGIWGGAVGFPGPNPAESFKDYIRRNELPAGHYYSAYPEASTRMVSAALSLRPHVRAFDAAASAREPEDFLIAYRRFLVAVQEYL